MKRLLLLCLTALSLQAEMFFTPKMINAHLKGYSEKEVALIEKDLSVVRSICLDGTVNAETPFYLATAGAPGARKSTILEKFLASHPQYSAGVYLDPDPRTLKFMAHTYYAESLNPLVISSTGSYDQVIKNAYDKWRYASNYIVLTLLEEAYAAGRSIVYGTTSTGAHTPDYFAKLKERGYQIVLLLCSCSDELRRQSIEYRNKVVRFYQSSPEDALSKGKFFPARMSAYFAYGDLLYLYWSDDLSSPERLAAIWRKGELEIVDQDAMNLFVEKYEADRKALLMEGEVIPPFEDYLK